ncbi:MAG: hypothetical protein Q9M36_08930 [Sulfurovum sp.]|nr:hypothetical protein [Sulfurovum sp.]
MLSYYYCWKHIIKRPILISEHWSAYHFNFYMPWESKKLERIKKIFRQNIPIITVSKTLLNDIENFSNTQIPSSIIIPNVIDQSTFFYNKKENNQVSTFFSVNHIGEILKILFLC